jgi:hypothetical protein
VSGYRDAKDGWQASVCPRLGIIPDVLNKKHNVRFRYRDAGGGQRFAEGVATVLILLRQT